MCTVVKEASPLPPLRRRLGDRSVNDSNLMRLRMTGLLRGFAGIRMRAEKRPGRRYFAVQYEDGRLMI